MCLIKIKRSHWKYQLQKDTYAHQPNLFLSKVSKYFKNCRWVKAQVFLSNFSKYCVEYTLN